MKKAYLLIAFIALIITGCKKESSVTASTSTGGLQGRWELKSSFNGWVGNITYPSGNGHIYVFSGDTYQTYNNGSIAQQGTYTLKQQFSAFQNQQINTIVFDNNTSAILMGIDLNGDQLTFSIQAYDAGGSVYQRIK